MTAISAPVAPPVTTAATRKKAEQRAINEGQRVRRWPQSGWCRGVRPPSCVNFADTQAVSVSVLAPPGLKIDPPIPPGSICPERMSERRCEVVSRSQPN